MNLLECPSPRIATLDRNIPVVFPIAALEQHGPHLPLFTDSLLLAEIVRRAHAGLQNRALIAPLQWLGNSEHHLDFPGTLSAAPRTYLDLLKEMARSFIRHGFKRIVFLNGHGGNMVPAQQATFELRQEMRADPALLLLHATYWSLAQRDNPGIPGLEQNQMGHACEWETSMMLTLRPDLVGEYKNLPPVPSGNPFGPANRAWITLDRSRPGYIGCPHLATAAKGEHLLAAFSTEVGDLLERVIAWDGVSWDG